MFEAVKLVSPSSSSFSLAPFLTRRKTIKTFLIFHQPHAVKKKEQNHHHQQKPHCYRFRCRQSYCTLNALHSSRCTSRQKGKKTENFGNLFENDNF
jgi:hypothetical protein